MKWMSDETMKALHRALEAFGAEPRATTTFARCWSAVGPLEDYAAIAETPAERLLVQLLRWLLERALWKTAPRDASHPDARGVEEILPHCPRRPQVE